MMRLYFAHPVTDYGTAWEWGALVALSQCLPGWEIVNPNRPDWQDGYARFGMQFFIERCGECDAVAWTPFPDGSVGAGVAAEVASFVERSRPVLKIDREHQITSALPPAALTVEQTRALIASLRSAA